MAASKTIERGVSTMGGLGKAIYQEGVVDVIISCMSANGCTVEEALAMNGYDRAEWPPIIEAVNACIGRERSDAWGL